MTTRREKAKELLPIIKAYSEGKEIQYQRLDGVWIDNEDMDFSLNWKYRIKPENIEVDIGIIKGGSYEAEKYNYANPPVDMRYRPFKNFNEIVSARNTNMIWIVKKDSETVNLITAFDNTPDGACVFIQDVWIDMLELFRDYRFQDGTPCAVMEVII